MRSSATAITLLMTRVITTILLSDSNGPIVSTQDVLQGGHPNPRLRCDPEIVSCRCGSDFKEVNVQIRKCKQNVGCEPCPDILSQKTCVFMQNCTQCSEEANVFLDWCKRMNLMQDCGCKNGGTCLPEGLCLCAANFTGKLCEIQDHPNAEPSMPMSTQSNEQELHDITCPLPNYPVNGNLFFDTDKLAYMDYVKYVCNDGFTLIGNSVRRCQEDGRLSGVEPKCEKLCSIPKITGNQVGTNIILNPDNDTSTIDVFGNVIVNVIQFYCDEGWRLNGPSKITCVNGKWNKELPSCRWYGVSCRDPGIPEHSERQPPAESSIWAPGTTFQFSCVDNTIIYHGQASILVCSYSGQWSSPPPQCLDASARTLQADVQTEEVSTRASTTKWAGQTVGVQVTTPAFQDTSVGTQIQPTDTNGAETTISTTKKLLNGNIPEICSNCCPQPTKFNHGTAWVKLLLSSFSTLNKFSDFVPQGSTITYACDTFYEMEKNVSRTCQSNNMWSGEEPRCKPTCGQINNGHEGLIFGGKLSRASKWPWPVAFIHQKVGSLFCAGTLLSENWVVTAAHCVAEFNKEDITMYLGKTSFDQPMKDRYILERRVQQIIIHQNFNPQSKDSDIALLMMNEPATFDKYIKPICLPREDSMITHQSGNTGTVCGWGSIDPVDIRISPNLREIEIPVVDCNGPESNSNASKYATATDNMFCGGYEKGDRGVCHGDSGSGLYFTTGDKSDPRYVLEGIVSWGPSGSCAAPGIFARFVRVHNFVGWIREQITDVV